MKAVILAGGYGTRLSEETDVRPKPMVEIGGKPILWHILKIYAAHGINDFIICAGYKSYVIKEYFFNYFIHNSDIEFDLQNNSMRVIEKKAEPWKVTVVDTGEGTLTGGRLKRIANLLNEDEAFCFTYGDGVSNVDVQSLVAFHKDNGKKATLTAVQPPGRFGAVELDSGCHVERFAEKPQGEQAWINGGFFVLEPSVLEYIEGDMTSWETGPLDRLAAEGELMAFCHTGFWRPMDTLRDKHYLCELWNSGKAPWRIW